MATRRGVRRRRHRRLPAAAPNNYLHHKRLLLLLLRRRRCGGALTSENKDAKREFPGVPADTYLADTTPALPLTSDAVLRLGFADVSLDGVDHALVLLFDSWLHMRILSYVRIVLTSKCWIGKRKSDRQRGEGKKRDRRVIRLDRNTLTRTRSLKTTHESKSSFCVPPAPTRPPAEDRQLSPQARATRGGGGGVEASFLPLVAGRTNTPGFLSLRKIDFVFVVLLYNIVYFFLPIIVLSSVPRSEHVATPVASWVCVHLLFPTRRRVWPVS